MSLMKINKSSISTKTWQRSEFFFKVLRALKIEPPVLIRFFHVFASSPPLTWVGHHFINIIYNKHSPVSIYGRLSERSLFYYYRNITDSDFVVFFVFFWSKQTMGHVLVVGILFSIFTTTEQMKWPSVLKPPTQNPIYFLNI